MSETRKLAAILVSDVVGYSRFGGGADWGACLQRLLACTPHSSFLKGLYP
jgi:hypothetical protein